MKTLIACFYKRGKCHCGSLKFLARSGLWHVSRNVQETLGDLPCGEFLANDFTETTGLNLLAAPHNLPLTQCKAVCGLAQGVKIVWLYGLAKASVFHEVCG